MGKIYNVVQTSHVDFGIDDVRYVRRIGDATALEEAFSLWDRYKHVYYVSQVYGIGGFLRPYGGYAGGLYGNESLVGTRVVMLVAITFRLLPLPLRSQATRNGEISFRMEKLPLATGSGAEVMATFKWGSDLIMLADLLGSDFEQAFPRALLDSSYEEALKHLTTFTLPGMSAPAGGGARARPTCIIKWRERRDWSTLCVRSRIRRSISFSEHADTERYGKTLIYQISPKDLLR